MNLADAFFAMFFKQVKFISSMEVHLQTEPSIQDIA